MLSKWRLYAVYCEPGSIPTFIIAGSFGEAQACHNKIYKHVSIARIEDRGYCHLAGEESDDAG